MLGVISMGRVSALGVPSPPSWDHGWAARWPSALLAASPTAAFVPSEQREGSHVGITVTPTPTSSWAGSDRSHQLKMLSPHRPALSLLPTHSTSCYRFSLRKIHFAFQAEGRKGQGSTARNSRQMVPPFTLDLAFLWLFGLVCIYFQSTNSLAMLKRLYLAQYVIHSQQIH